MEESKDHKQEEPTEKQKPLDDNTCEKCGLLTVIPNIPMYCPYNVLGKVEVGKQYRWCRYQWIYFVI
jgi:hypothetical protein